MQKRVPGLVLDTNVVLDWLLFGDPRTEALGLAIAAGRLRWVASRPMRDELELVLLRGIPTRPDRPAAPILQVFDRHAELTETSGRPVHPSLRCADPDDQMFIDLALDSGVSTLLSRDRAVLRLARAAAVFRLRITTPEGRSE